MKLLAILGLLVLGTTGCGLGLFEASSGGGENLPTVGAGPYGRLDPDFDTLADEPFVVSDRMESYSDAACLARGNGGVRLWFTFVTDDDADAGRAVIGRAEIPGLHDNPDVPPTEALTPGEDWEQDRIGAPAIVEVDDVMHMYYEAGTTAPVIGHATSSDGGITWTRTPDPVLAAATDPTVTYVDGLFHLFVVRSDAEGIFHARSDDGLSFDLDADPTITRRPGVEEAFDTRGVGEPFVLVEVSDAGRHHWGLWFTGSTEVPDAGPAPTAIGYAGSFDGETWQRFGGVEPVLVAPAGGPCALLDGGSGVLLYHEDQRLHLGIAAAVHP